MRRCGFPVLLLDLSMIIYRTIFILLDQLVQIYHAQVMRRGYSAPRESIRSFAMLCGAVFIGSWEAGEDLIRAMDARCYDGKFAILGDIGPLRPAPVLAVGLFLALSAGIVLYTRDISLLHGVVA
jgi:cobalt/nickel transport system permease protein